MINEQCIIERHTKCKGSHRSDQTEAILALHLQKDPELPFSRLELSGGVPAHIYWSEITRFHKKETREIRIKSR